MIKLNYNKAEDIIYVQRYGEVSFEDLMEHIANIDQQFQNHKNLYLLTDTKGSSMNRSIDEYQKIIQEIKLRIETYQQVKVAFIVEQPLMTAFSLIFEELSNKIKNMSYKTFSTETAAKKWLKE